MVSNVIVALMAILALVALVLCFHMENGKDDESVKNEENKKDEV